MIAQRILVCTDFSPASRPGVQKAAELARMSGAHLTVCHVLDPSPLAPIATRAEPDAQLELQKGVEEAIHEALTKLVEEQLQGVAEVRTALILSTNASQGICNYAEKEDIDMIVISTHGRTGLAKLLIGSVAEKVVRHATCPVLTVRGVAPEA